jgi:hypothetical protein
MKTLLAIISLITGIGLLNYSEPDHIAEIRPGNHFVAVTEELKTGDIVLRSGKGLISDMFRSFSPSGSPWSHAGVLVVENGAYYVYHIIGNPGKKFDGICREKLTDFCSSHTSKGYSVYRFTGVNFSESEMISRIRLWQKSGIRFDEHFDLNDDRRMYCTEMIYKLHSGLSDVTLPVSEFRGRSYVSIDDLVLHRQSEKITEYLYP